MFNKTLSRPMFRRGGKAEGGITSGLRRQGYAGDDGNQNVIKMIWKKLQPIRVNLIKPFLHITMQVLIFSEPWIKYISSARR